MVVLWVVLEDLGLLSVLKIADEIVHSELLPPFFVGNKPIAPALSAYLLGREMQVLGTQCCWCEKTPHICLLNSTLNFRALRNLRRHSVSSRSV